VDYRQHLAACMVAFGSGDEAATRRELDEAMAAAAAVDPGGPRVAEVLGLASQIHEQAGRPREARDAGALALAIWERFEGAQGSLPDMAGRLARLSLAAGDAPGADAWELKARAWRG
jgi:hypothetical protein